MCSNLYIFQHLPQKITNEICSHQQTRFLDCKCTKDAFAAGAPLGTSWGTYSFSPRDPCFAAGREEEREDERK